MFSVNTEAHKDAAETLNYVNSVIGKSQETILATMVGTQDTSAPLAAAAASIGYASKPQDSAAGLNKVSIKTKLRSIQNNVLRWIFDFCVVFKIGRLILETPAAIKATEELRANTQKLKAINAALRKELKLSGKGDDLDDSIQAAMMNLKNTVKSS